MTRTILIGGFASLFPPAHGGAKNLRHVAERLARDGARVRVLLRLLPEGSPAPRSAGQSLEHLRACGAAIDALRRESAGRWSWRCAGVEYEGIPGGGEELAQAAEGALRALEPASFVLCDDSFAEGLPLYEAAARSGRLLFFAQTIHTLPFGPSSLKPSAAVARAIGSAARIVAPSRAVADYIERHLGRAAMVHYPDAFGEPPFPRSGRRDNPFVTMINPCPWKGSSILLGLARRRRDLEFAAVPTWGATPRLLEELKAEPNLTLLPETPRIDEIFSRTRVLLVPSLCQEAFGLVSPEAMLRGVPVIASDLAGLRESTLGAAPLIPVTPLALDGIDESTDLSTFIWQEPANPLEPWSAALDAILASEDAYERRSLLGRQAATRFVEGLRRRNVASLFEIERAPAQV